MNRAPSNVKVDVLDLSEHEEAAAQYMRDQGHADVVGAYCDTIGRVQTPHGVFVLDPDGVGPAEPITESKPLSVTFSPRWADGHFDLIPKCGAVMRFSDEHLLSAPVKETKPLHEFIRSFGSRLEYNYIEWERTLSESGVTA